MGKFGNKRKKAFLASFEPEAASISSDTDKLTEKCKFNFSYMDSSQAAGQDFGDWDHDELVSLLKKIQEYSEQPLQYWANQRVGAGGLKVLEIYGEFPKRSDFTHPKHVPVEAQWARFRLQGEVRLVGFVVPKSHHGQEHPITKECYDCNTFYVVFLDKNHAFYKLGKK